MSDDTATEPTAQSFGAFVRQKRTALELSQKTVAERIGTTQSYVGHVERRGQPTLEGVSLGTVVKFAAAFGVEPADFARELLDELAKDDAAASAA